MKSQFKTSQKGAAFTEYSILISLLGGLAIMAVLNMGNEVVAYNETSTISLTERLNLTSGSSPSSSSMTGSTPATEPPTAPTPAPTPSLVGYLYDVKGAWVSLPMPAPSSGYYNTYSPATVSLRIDANAPFPNRVKVGDYIAEYAIAGTRHDRIDYRTAGIWDFTSASMDATLIYSGERPGEVFILPRPSNATEIGRVEDNSFFRIYAYSSFPSSGTSTPSHYTHDNPTSWVWDCDGIEYLETPGVGFSCP